MPCQCATIDPQTGAQQAGCDCGSGSTTGCDCGTTASAGTETLEGNIERFVLELDKRVRKLEANA